MSRIFVTGSSQGIGAETARQLVSLGHEVVLHARTAERAQAATQAVPGAAATVVGALDSLASTAALAAAAEAHGPYDVIVHNAGIGGGADSRTETPDGLELIFHTNVVGPFQLTCLMALAPRMVYLTSGLEADGVWRPEDLQWTAREWHGMQAYSDSKLHDLMLATELAARHPEIVVNAVDPGWIKTRMGGPDAWDEVALGAETQVWLATSDEAAATASGRYVKRREELAANPVVGNADARAALVAALEGLTGLTFP